MARDCWHTLCVSFFLYVYTSPMVSDHYHSNLSSRGDFLLTAGLRLVDWLLTTISSTVLHRSVTLHEKSLEGSSWLIQVPSCMTNFPSNPGLWLVICPAHYALVSDYFFMMRDNIPQSAWDRASLDACIKLGRAWRVILPHISQICVCVCVCVMKEKFLYFGSITLIVQWVSSPTVCGIFKYVIATLKQ